jgi:hypothetical protein
LIGRVEDGRYNELDPGDGDRRTTRRPLQVGRVVIIDLGYPETVTLRAAGGHLPRSRAGRWRLLLHWPFGAPDRCDVWGCFREGDRMVIEDVVDIRVDEASSLFLSQAGFRETSVPRVIRDPRYFLTATLPPQIAYGGEANRSRERLVRDTYSHLFLFVNWLIIATAALFHCSTRPDSALYLPSWTAWIPTALFAGIVVHRRIRWRRYRTAWPWHARFETANPESSAADPKPSD